MASPAEEGSASAGPPRLPIGVLFSGAGTNLRAILEQSATGRLSAEVRIAITNRPRAAGLAFGQTHGVPTMVFARDDHAGRDAQQGAIAAELEARGVELVVLAGFDQILSDAFVARFSSRLINLHPSLLPAFAGGMHAVRDALLHGAKVTGCTVHFVDSTFPEPDSGPIIVQQSVPILDDDTEESLLTRVHQAEYEALPAAIQLFAERRLSLEGRRVRIGPSRYT